MATYTITTGNSVTPVDYAALGTRVNGDVYNINGGYLKVDVDTRYGLGGAAAASIGNIVGSDALGGTILFDSTKVRTIAYTGGSGTVPAADTVISKGGASGKLIGVYASLTVAPTAAAGVMPATGYIKIRMWNSVSYTAGALTGITATGAVDRAGWLEIVGLDTSTATVNRLNEFLVTGDFYDFQGATTTGVNTGTYQLPTNGSTANYWPGIEVETIVPGVFEFFPCAGSLTAIAANVATDNERGELCWIAAATGLVRFGHDGTNSTGGFVPPAGRKIRVPSIYFNCSVAAAVVNIIPNSTLATRYKFLTTGGGVIDISKASMNWYCNFAQPYGVSLNNTYTFESVILSECATAINWNMVGTGMTAANTQTSLTMSMNFAGGTMTNCKWTRAAQAATTTYVAAWNDCAGFTLTNCRDTSLIKAANGTSGSMSLLRVSDSTWSNQLLGGGRVYISTCSNLTFMNTSYYDHPATTTTSGTPMYTFSVEASSSNITIDGVDFCGLVGVAPYSGIVANIGPGNANLKVRNIGTATTPLDCGGPQTNATWTQATTTASVTAVGHGLKVGDVIYVQACSGIASITVGTKTVVAITSTNVFTFACNTGSLTGTLTYFLTLSAYAVAHGNGAAANGSYIQRVYTSHTRSGFVSGDNSSKNVVVENGWGGPYIGDLYPMLNFVAKQSMTTPAFTAQTSTYGTHFGDYLSCYPTPNLVSVSWTRVTTVATITSANHNLRTLTANLPINVTATSDALAIVLGLKIPTVMTDNTFTIPCLNAGATSGTLTFDVGNGRMCISMNEPTSKTMSCVTLGSGVFFTSAGGLYMPTVGHQADFTWSYSPIGYVRFPILEAVMVGGGAIANFDITYSINGGVYRNLYYSRLVGGGANGASTITMTSTTGVTAGDYVWGTNVGWNAKVVSVVDATTCTVSLPNIGTVSGTLRFGNLPNEIISASVGFSFKVRIITAVANTTAITALNWFTFSDTNSRLYQYPLDQIVLTLTGLQSGSDIAIVSAGTSTELINIDNNIGSTYNYSYSATSTVDICVYKAGYVPFAIRNYVLGNSNASLPIAQFPDRNYI